MLADRRGGHVFSNSQTDEVVGAETELGEDGDGDLGLSLVEVVGAETNSGEDGDGDRGLVRAEVVGADAELGGAAMEI